MKDDQHLLVLKWLQAQMRLILRADDRNYQIFKHINNTTCFDHNLLITAPFDVKVL